MPSESVELSDPRVLKAIAHPARWRVLEELYGGRTLTATQAGDLCGLSGSAMSYHLRKLADLGLVTAAGEPDDDASDGRERPWRAAHDGLAITGRPGPVIGRAMMANVLESVRRLLTEMAPGLSDPAHWPPSYTHGRLRLTDERAKELNKAVSQVIEDFEVDEPPPGPDAPPVREFFWLQGVAPDQPGEGRTDPS